MVNILNRIPPIGLQCFYIVCLVCRHCIHTGHFCHLYTCNTGVTDARCTLWIYRWVKHDSFDCCCCNYFSLDKAQNAIAHDTEDHAQQHEDIMSCHLATNNITKVLFVKLQVSYFRVYWQNCRFFNYSNWQVVVYTIVIELRCSTL